MSKLMERVAGERGRLKEVRQAMTAAVEQGANGAESFVPFYIAVGNYFEAAMHRLHEQDIRMGDMLRAKAEMDEPANQQALSELEERLAGNQAHLKALLAARDALRDAGTAALADFEAAGKAYSDYIVTNMGHHPGSTNLAQQLFTAEDWEHMAYVTDADLVREQQLHTAVFDAQPDAQNLPVQN
jgi:hypothetical protein